MNASPVAEANEQNGSLDKTIASLLHMNHTVGGRMLEDMNRA
jgi:hypothetical protein